jgi:glutathione S-transferase
MGHPAFERAYRVQMNTLENAVVFLPVLWLFAAFVNEVWSAVLGAVWLAGRAWFAVAYQKDPATRGPGFTLSMFAFSVLALGSAWGVIKAFV